ncbi:MAG: hypothetical protein V4530_09410 [Pseudomonadota bacterium]
MNQRGITADLVNLTLQYGAWDGDRCQLSQKSIDRRLAEIDCEKRRLLRARDKGGLTVVEAGGTQITAYAMKKLKGRLGHA